jgi:hypothetical protein
MDTIKTPVSRMKTAAGIMIRSTTIILLSFPLILPAFVPAAYVNTHEVGIHNGWPVVLFFFYFFFILLFVKVVKVKNIILYKRK